MTALPVLEGDQARPGDPGAEAAFSYAWKYGGESAALHPGDVLTVGELLEALLLPSGADAAYTLANTYGPGLDAFVARMNATAARMGMTQTHFTSPDGLPYPTETSTYSTPSDLLALGLAAMRYPVFRSIVGQRFYQLRKGPGHHAYWWDNTNDLIGSYQGAAGIKTGYTDDAGHCLLFEATRNGRTLIGAVLGSPATGPAAGHAGCHAHAELGLRPPPHRLNRAACCGAVALSRVLAQGAASRSTGWPVIWAITSKSLSRCRTVRPASSAVAAMIRSGIEREPGAGRGRRGG